MFFDGSQPNSRWLPLTRFAGVLGFLLGSIFAPPAGNAQEANPQGHAFFEQHIRPVLAQRCYSCHSQKHQKREGGLTVDSRAALLTGGHRGSAVVPKDRDASLLLQALKHDDGDLQMPPDAPLAPQTVRHFEHWIQLGAPWPADASMAENDDWRDPSDPIAGRSHWAFQPLHPPRTTANQNSTGSVEAQSTADVIDHLIGRKLTEHQLHPAPAADRRTLLRRTSFQLLGLPPEPEHLSEFLSDTRPDAFARQVDRMLASSHFGERWGRHWLDLARYADSNGLDENFLFREAWRYRNRVIELVNADTSFDRFLEEQIAGDLLPWETVEQRDQQRISAGFLVIGPKVLLGNNPQERIMDVADEQLDTIGRGVLGMTLGCARCHDHKFDPVPTKDYYSLAGILTSTSVMQRRYMLGQQRVMEQLIGLGPDGDQLNREYETYWRERPAVQERQKQARSALQLLQQCDESGLSALAKKHSAAVAKTALHQDTPLADRVAAQQQHLEAIAAILKNQPPIPPRAMIPADTDKPADEAIRLAGRFDRKGEVAARGFLQVLTPDDVDLPNDQSGRLQLARWLTDTKNGAGHLAARVLANRIWHHLIGQGLVRTVDNFGRTGEPPSHPELLDHLARRLIDSGWSMKSLIRDIVLSHTFQQSSRFESTAWNVDPGNRLLWRAHRRRLDPESLRDAMLHCAGTLDRSPLDSTVDYLGDQATSVGSNDNRRRTDYRNRSVYLPVIRNDLPELFEAFDFADPHAATGRRANTLIPLQALFMMNDDDVMQAAEATVQHVVAAAATDQERVQILCQRVLNSDVTPEEQTDILAFIREFEQTALDGEPESPDDPDNARLQAWATACHALFASSRFQTLE